MESEEKLRNRVVTAAESVLAEKQFVSPVDVLVGIRLLEPVHLKYWQTGRVPFLEELIQGNPIKISNAMHLFREWATARGLRPTEAKYLNRSQEPLRFSASGDPNIEAAYRTHYISPLLPEKKQQKLEEKLNQPPEKVVYSIIRESKCSKCAEELWKGSLLFMHNDQPLCMKCAGMDDLVYLASGDAALTRRATKYTERKAVVVRFSRSRQRYERQGLLLEKKALEQAAEELGKTLDPDF